MARGQQAKETIVKKIFEVFPDAFMNDKELRIPVMEAGELIQVKVTLTAAKTNIENTSSKTDFPAPPPKTKNATEPTSEEINNLKIMMEKLGL